MDIKDLEKLPAEVQALKNGQKLLVIQMQVVHEKVDRLLQSAALEHPINWHCNCSISPTKPEPIVRMRERTPWTEDQDRLLLRDFSSFIDAEAHIMGRTENAIRARLRTLQKDYHQYRSGR